MVDFVLAFIRDWKADRLRVMNTLRFSLALRRATDAISILFAQAYTLARSKAAHHRNPDR